jgi:hypothetical protein
MKVIRKGSLLKREEIEMSPEEYKAYNVGYFWGLIDGLIIGIGSSLVIWIIEKTL